MNEWLIVAELFDSLENENERPERRVELFRDKFDKLVNVNKPTGKPSYPVPVRPANLIAREIISRVAASSLGCDDVSNCDTDRTMDITSADATQVLHRDDGGSRTDDVNEVTLSAEFGDAGGAHFSILVNRRASGGGRLKIRGEAAEN